MFPFKFNGLYFCSHREDSTKGVGFNIGSFSSSSPPDKDIQIHFCCSALLWGLGWFSCMLMGCSMLCCSTSSCVSMHSLFPTSKRWNTSWNTGFGTWAASCANCFTSFTRRENNAEVGTVFCHWPYEKSCQRRCLGMNDASGFPRHLKRKVLKKLCDEEPAVAFRLAGYCKQIVLWAGKSPQWTLSP